MSDRKKQLLELLQSDPNDVFLHYALGMEALSENDLQAALTQFQKTIGLQENYHAAETFKLMQREQFLNVT